MAQPGHTGDVNAMGLSREYNLVSEMLSAMEIPCLKVIEGLP